MVTSLVAAVGVINTPTTEASDHDDGENAFKNRALNLTDHFAFKSTDPATPNDLSLIMYFNPRSLPGKQYFLATNARYEFHVSKVNARTDDATVNDNFVFRFEAAEPDANGQQALTLTIIKDGTVLGTHNGMSTTYAASKANTGLIDNAGETGGISHKYFVGMRADSFTFDVVRFFQVRKFLADRFFGGPGGTGDPDAVGRLAPNCKGQGLLAGVLGTPEVDGDNVNLFNPPDCAPDFTKNYNVTAIALNVPIADLGGTIFDTWSTVSVAQ